MLNNDKMRYLKNNLPKIVAKSNNDKVQVWVYPNGTKEIRTFDFEHGMVEIETLEGTDSWEVL